jgi:hypothetical protein
MLALGGLINLKEVSVIPQFRELAMSFILAWDLGKYKSVGCVFDPGSGETKFNALLHCLALSAGNYLYLNGDRYEDAIFALVRPIKTGRPPV